MDRRAFMRLTGMGLVAGWLERVGFAAEERAMGEQARRIMIGVSAYPNADIGLMREAGIEWVRHGFSVPFTDRLNGKVSEAYREEKAEAERWVAAGMKLMGITPGPGSQTFERDAAGQLRPVWHNWMPDWCGPLGSEQNLRSFEAICAWMARDLKGMVAAWQVCNELECPNFAGPLNLRQACELILAGAGGLKASDGSLFVGMNTGGDPEGYYLFGRLFADPAAPLDYCGDDEYYGSWHPGGPEQMADRIPELHAITGKPVVLNEFGFSSAGEPKRDASGRLPEGGGCETKSWWRTWGPGHTPEGQAEFVRVIFDAFRAQRDELAGVFFYRWEDQARCWSCGSPDCPIETRWGLVDLKGKPKPAYHAFKEGVLRLRATD